MNIYDIAEQANVSTATVSKGLNGKVGVGVKTRERILKIMHDNDYSPRISNTEVDSIASVYRTGGRASILTQLAYQLENFLKDAAKIPKQLDSFKSNIASVSSLMLNLQEQSLYLDYIPLVPSGQAHRDKAGFFKEMQFFFSSFFSSFFNDYSIIGTQGESNRQIRVWYSGGREQANWSTQ